jgi:hypothetical protein
VGVTPASPAAGPAGSAAAPDAGSDAGPVTSPARVVRVRRTGGFAGRATDGEVDLEAGDPLGEEVRSLVDRIDLTGLRGGMPHPDMFVYEFDVLGSRATVPEQHLTADLRRLADLVLGRGGGPVA